MNIWQHVGEVIVGVNWNGGTEEGNPANTATQHFVTIVGSGSEGGRKYYTFYDPGTKWESKGASPNNKLYVNSDSSLSGTSEYNKDTKSYVVTQVSPQ